MQAGRSACAVALNQPGLNTRSRAESPYVSNVFVSGFNMGFDPEAYLAALPDTAIDELHLGGFTLEDDDATPGGTLLVDTHAAPVAQDVWPLYRAALTRFGAVPTLIEWDNDLPALTTLLGEAERANSHMSAVNAEALNAAR